MTPRDELGPPRIEPCPVGPLVATVLICTYNRAASLAATLDTIASTRLVSLFPWEVLIVDNNSSDDTRHVV